MPSTRNDRRPGAGLDVDQVRAALKAHAEELFRAAFGEPGRRSVREWRDPKGKISMKMQGDERGLWKDFSSDEGGDLFDLVGITRCGVLKARDDFPNVLEEAGRMTGLATRYDGWRGFPKPAPRPEKKPERPKRDQRDWDARRVVAVIDGIRPAAGTPAAAYLARRGVTDLPETGLGWLPGMPALPVLHRRRGALLVWAQNQEGWPTGGQRILVTPTGRPARVKENKPTFARVGGFPARFPARKGMEGEPLVVAEGPETALSIRQATGLECWAVFGVSNFRTAPLPEGRRVILAPDRDERDSQAGLGFRRAVFVQRSRGVDLLIAEAPEPDGSGDDLNDTLLRAGDDEVRAAIEAARPVTDADVEECET